MRVASWVAWSAGAALVCLALGATYRWAFGPLAPLPDPGQAVRDSAARVHAADSVRWAVERQGLTRTVATLGRERDSLRNLRNAKPVRVTYVRDSRMANMPSLGGLVPGNNSSPAAGLSDSTPMVHLSDYQSLERELAIADSLIGTQAAIIRADSVAYSHLGSLRAFEDSTHREAYGKLARDLANARRGPRFLGLPVPELGAGYCATVTGGQVRTGPCVSLSIKVRL